MSVVFVRKKEANYCLLFKVFYRGLFFSSFQNISGRSKGALGTPPPLSIQILSFSWSFRQKFYKVIDWRTYWGVGPPLGNPGSATEYICWEWIRCKCDMNRELIWEINCEKSVFLRRSVNSAQTLTLTKKESRHMTTARLLSVSAHLFFFFFLNFCWTHVHLWGHWYPCFGLQVTYPLGFKARVGSALLALGGGICMLWKHMCVSAEVGCRDLNRWPPAQQSDTLPTRPRRLAHLCLLSPWILKKLTIVSRKNLIWGR